MTLICKREIQRKGKRGPRAAVASATVPEVDTRIALIQALIPVGLEAFHAELQRELASLVGERYACTGRQAGLGALDPASRVDLPGGPEAPDHGAAGAGPSARIARSR